MVFGQINQKVKEFDTNVRAWVGKQPLAIEVAVTALSSAAQGGAIGGLMGTLAPDASTLPTPPGVSPEAAKSVNAVKALAGGPWQQARNFAIMAGTNAGIHCLLRRVRGVDDARNSFVAGFGSGAIFSLASGVGGDNPAMSAFATGSTFGAFQGALTWAGEKFGNKQVAEDPNYLETRSMLEHLGLQKYEKNFRKGQLTDTTLPLLTDSVLKDVNIPPGPRLLILQESKRY